MSPTKLLLGQAIVTVAIVLCALVTQWAAMSLGYQPRLGSAWVVVSDVPVYLPWRHFHGWDAYEAYSPRIFNTTGAMAAGGGVAAIVVAVAGSL